MFSQACVILFTILPHGYSDTAYPCYGAIGMHPTGMPSCLEITPVVTIRVNVSP